MKAITIWQPWASLILHGFKPYEFRGWHPGAGMIGQRIAIHAGARKIPKRELQALILRLRRGGHGMGLRPGAGEWIEQHAGPQCANLPHGAVIATANLTGAPRSDQVLHEFGERVENDSDRGDHFNFAWRMETVEPVLPPDPAAGKQGWWEWQGAA